MSFRDVAALPFFAGAAGVVLLLGTVVNQPPRHNTDNDIYNPMTGMNMTGMNMGGMKMGGDAATSSTASATMPGMDMTTGTGTATGTAATGPAAATMTMPDGSTMPNTAMSGGGMPMNMSDPKMAAAMPGGLHSTCAGQTCSVIFAPTATGTAKILGTTVKLVSATTKQVTLTVGNKKLTVHQGKPVTDGKLRIELISATAQAYTVKFTKLPAGTG